MSEDEDEAKARAELNRLLDQFTEEVREVMQRKVNDSLYVRDVLKGEREAKNVVYSWVQRILIEAISDDLGEDRLASMFSNYYYQINSMKLGPKDFWDKAKPYD